MDTNWATEHLQVIRTLMERSALYRRALAPIMLISGGLGLLGLGVAHYFQFNTIRSFTTAWIAIGATAMTLALVLVRRQAIKDSEPFWSLPTQRVAAGLFPCFFCGLIVGLVAILHPEVMPAWLLASLWSLNYGCALRAAGFFVQRGIRLFGGAFLMAGAAILFGAAHYPWLTRVETAHTMMGTLFGGLHLAYGVYLYFTERRHSS